LLFPKVKRVSGAHLLNNPVGDARQVLLFKVHEHDTGLQATTEVEQRVERERRNVRSAPSVSAFLNILFVFDPTRRLLPLAFLASTLQFIEL
jgi:hypothetical protein